MLSHRLSFTLLFWAQTRIDSGLALIRNGTTPLWTVRIAPVVTHDERLRTGKVVAVAVGVLGVAAMLPGSVRVDDATPILAEIACLATALS